MNSTQRQVAIHNVNAMSPHFYTTYFPCPTHLQDVVRTALSADIFNMKPKTPTATPTTTGTSATNAPGASGHSTSSGSGATTRAGESSTGSGGGSGGSGNKGASPGLTSCFPSTGG